MMLPLIPPETLAPVTRVSPATTETGRRCFMGVPVRFPLVSVPPGWHCGGMTHEVTGVAALDDERRYQAAEIGRAHV